MLIMVSSVNMYLSSCARNCLLLGNTVSVAVVRTPNAAPVSVCYQVSLCAVLVVVRVFSA